MTVFILNNTMSFSDRLRSVLLPSWRVRTGAPKEPSFLCVGAMKCGTTSLHDYLAAHPEVSVPSVKETDFLSRSVSTITIDEYEAKFCDAPIRGECCPQYLLEARTVQRVYPQTTIIVVVREPVARLVSHLRHLADRYPDRFERSYAAIEDGRLGATFPYEVLSFGLYADHLLNYKRHGFEPHVLSFHDLVERPRKFFERVCTIIGASFVEPVEGLHSHASSGRPAVSLSTAAEERLRQFYQPSNNVLSRDYGVDFPV